MGGKEVNTWIQNKIHSPLLGARRSHLAVLNYTCLEMHNLSRTNWANMCAVSHFTINVFYW